MRTKSLIGIVSSVAIVFLVIQGLQIYLYTSCGQYRIFEPACSKLLSAAETQEFLEQNQNLVDDLTQVRPGMIEIFVREESRCPGKSILVIEHPSERECDALNEILHSDAFDIPYKILNY